MSGAAQRDHLAYAPEHGLYAVYRGAGGVVLAAVLAVIGCAGAFVPWPSFQLRPIAHGLVVLGWVVWWWIVAIVALKAAYRLTTDVLVSVEMGIARFWSELIRFGAVLAVLGYIFVLMFSAVSSSSAAAQGVGSVSVIDFLIWGVLPVPSTYLEFAAGSLACLVWVLTPGVSELRAKCGLDRRTMVMAVACVAAGMWLVFTLVARLGVLDWYLAAVLSFAMVTIALLLLAWLAAGLRRRIAAILGAIARIEGEEAGRGEVAKVFSGEAGAGRETD